MAASPGISSSSKGSALSKDKADAYGQLLDERDFDAMLLVHEPDLQKTIQSQSSDHWPKRFFASTDEISETVLSQGFSFPRREPPRPGQFSKRPLHSPLRIPEKVELQNPEKLASRQTSISPPSKDAFSPRFPKGAPLDLPELCLPSHTAVSLVGNRKETQLIPQLVPLSPHRSSEGQPSSQQISQTRSKEKSPDSRELLLPRPSATIQAPEPIETSHQNSSCPGNPSTSSPETFPSKSIEKTKTIARTSSSPKHTSSPIRGGHEAPQQTTHGRHDVLPFKDHLHISKLPPRHVQRVNRHERQQSPTSTCGDLEGPTHRSPVRPRRYTREDFVNRPVACRTPHKRESLSRHRSQSRASNISKKRAAVHKHRSRSDPDRKKMAMHQVAQYWNECIQIAEEENMQANLEIERLQEDICRQEQELRESRAEMGQKDNKIRDIESRFKELQEEDSRVIGENKVLSSELESLRGQLSESKERGETLAERYRTYRLKLNEAIKEQQALFLKSRSFYQETMDQLRKENAIKTVDSEAIDKALENSRKKREEIKKCLEEFRTETERKIQNKDQTIAELQGKIKDHEVNLGQERDLTDRLRAQIEAQQNTRRSVKDLEAKLDSLLALHAKKDEEHQREHQTNAQIMDQIHAKLDSIIADNQQSASNMLSLNDIEPKLADVQDKIVARILPEILGMVNGQNSIGDAISQLQAVIKRELDGIRDEISHQNEKCRHSHEETETHTHVISDLLKKFGEDLEKTQGACEQMEQRLETWAESERAHGEASKSCLNDLTQQLMDRGARIEDLEHRLQVVCDCYASKVDAMQVDALTDGEATRKMVQDTVAELRSALDDGFKLERERTEKSLHQSETSMGTLMAQLKEAKEQLGQLAKVNTNDSPNIQALRKSLQGEQEVIIQLKREIQELEQKATANERLRDRWRQDIQAIDVMRSQLMIIQEQMPFMEGYGAKLDRIVELNEFIQSTACYLASEREWVHQQLEGKTQAQTAEATSSRPSIKEPAATSGAIESHDRAQSQVAREEFNATVSQPFSKADITCRKVTVHSPAGHAKSPSPPPSVHQEQRRRREVTQLRSILKNHTPSEPESHSLEGGSLHPQVNHSKYNRPVVGVFSNAGPGLANGVVAEIRSGLIRQFDWRLPTVADFERNNHLASSKGQSRHDKRLLPKCDDVEDRDAKKIRTEQHAA